MSAQKQDTNVQPLDNPPYPGAIGCCAQCECSGEGYGEVCEPCPDYNLNELSCPGNKYCYYSETSTPCDAPPIYRYSPRFPAHNCGGPPGGGKIYVYSHDNCGVS